jgi:DNA-directed RNA polymerase subunit L
MKKHKISNAYDVYHFLHEHPKLMLEERNEVSPEEAVRLEAVAF